MNDTNHRGGWWGTLAISAMLAACGGSDDDPPPPTTPAAATPLSCTQLAGMAIPAASIGLPTSGGAVTTAVVAAPAARGHRRRRVLPRHRQNLAGRQGRARDRLQGGAAADWNAKAVMFGGGGFDGTMPNVAGNVPNGPTDQPTPLGRGYATFASDSGHQANALGSQDSSFGLNDEAVDNFGGDAMKKTHDAATFLIHARYAREPRKAYFAGGSTGGREAMASIPRWPADWDGAIAWYPAWNDAAASCSAST